MPDISGYIYYLLPPKLMRTEWIRCRLCGHVQLAEFPEDCPENILQCSECLKQDSEVCDGSVD